MALRLQWPPFIWLFRFYYWLALQSTRVFISRVEGVRSIYLTGSWVKRDIIYGLSDIDSQVLVSGKKNQKTYASIRGKFSFLRRSFLCWATDNEKGIYFLDTFEFDYRHYPLMQHLFDARFFEHQLQWGENLMARIPIRHWKELDRGECAFSRLKDWIERIHILAVYDGFSEQQNSIFFSKL